MTNEQLHRGSTIQSVLKDLANIVTSIDGLVEIRYLRGIDENGKEVTIDGAAAYLPFKEIRRLVLSETHERIRVLKEEFEKI